MTHPVRPITVLALLLACTPPAVAQVGAIWNGTSGNWTDSARWNTGLFPNNGNGGNNYNVQINGGTVTVDQAVTIQRFDWGGGTLAGGSLQVNSGGGLSGPTNAVASGGTISFGDGTTASTFSQTSLSNLYLNFGAAVTVQSNAVYTVDTSWGGCFIDRNTGAPGTFTVASGGTLRKTSNYVTGGNDLIVAVNLVNHGTIDIQAGKIQTLTFPFASFPTNAGTLNVASGATFDGFLTNTATGVLRGAGTVTRAVNLSAAGATVEAGTSASATTLTLQQGVTMANDSRYNVKLFGTGTADISRIAVTGGATINTGADLRLDLSGLAPGQVDALRTAVGAGNTRSYTVLTATDTVTGGFNAAGFSVTNLGHFAAGEWRFGTSGSNAVTLTFTPVPEPATVLAVGAAGLGLAGWLRRRGRTTSTA